MKRVQFRLATLLTACALASAAVPAAGADGAVPPEKPRTEVVWEWSPYYTNIGLHVPISDEATPDGGQMTESDVYRQLWARSFQPSVFVLEASAYPMPILGVWMRGHLPDLYQNAAIGNHNIVQTVTAGFQEPWAVSAFIGSEMKFSRPDEDRRDTNRGFMGYLMSVGKKHIKENALIDDDWVELEWKMKGERTFKDDRLSWSFRLGAKYNRNPEIAGTAYLGISRSSLDFKSPFLSFLDNSSVTLFTEVSRHSSSLLRQEIIFGKKYPSESRRLVWELDFGVIYERASKYTGSLAPLTTNSYTFVLRPNLVF
jgi:hypothetical protein